MKSKRNKQKNYNSFFKIDELIETNLDKIEQFKSNPDELLGLSTGFPKLNSITLGLQNSNLIVFASRPGIGKTSLALNIARNVLIEENVPVAIFSLEMTGNQISMRLLLSGARIDLYGLANKRIGAKEWRKLSDGGGELIDRPLFIDATPNISLTEIHIKASHLKKTLGLGLLVIDYIQLLKPSNLGTENSKIVDIARSLKTLAKELNIPVIALSQLDRHGENQSDNRQPLLSDFGKYDPLVQHADIVGFIHRKQVQNQNTRYSHKKTAKIIIAKNRNGATGTAYMNFLGQYTRFEELSRGSYDEFK